MATNKSFQTSAFQFLKDGIYASSPSGKKKRIADPILVTAFATNNEGTQREQAFVVIRFMNRRGKWRKEIVPSSMLTGHNNEFVALLSNLGYLWPPNKKLWPKLIGALSLARPDHDIHLTDVPGWLGKAYVLPGEAYTPEGPDQAHFLIRHNPSVKLGAFRRSGTVEQWKKIARLCRHSSRARCLMAAAFTAPNLRPLKIASFGLNLSGETSSAKTFLLSLATSAAGLNSSEGPETWDGSVPAYEQRALGHRDSIISFDDLGHVVGNPAEVAKLVTFRLASNRPKAKAGQYIHANNLADGEFRVIALSTSEQPIWEHLNNEQRRGRRVRGEEVRMINLPGCVSKLGDIFDGSKADVCIGSTVEERSKTIQKYAKLAVKYQGEAYRAYLANRVADKGAEAALQKYMFDYFKASPLPKEYRWLRRISVYFAAIYASAALAIDYGILPWGKKSTLAAIRACMNDAMNQLIVSFESGSNPGRTEMKSDGDQLIEFNKLINNASFVRINRKTRNMKSLTKQLNGADGIIRPDGSGITRTFLFSKSFDRWYSNTTTRKNLAKQLRSLRIYGKGRRADTGTREIFIAELGKVPCYALSRKRLRRSIRREGSSTRSLR